LSTVIVIGSGFAGMATATHLAKAGYKVTVLEKNDKPGGRANYFKAEGFTFDMGPSWYWMPEVFEKYFADFGASLQDYYQLVRLDPSYSIFYKDKRWDVPANFNELKESFNSIESGSGEQLEKFINEAAYKYNVGINKLVYKPGQSLSEFADWDLVKGVLKLDVFKSTRKHVRQMFKHPHIQNMLEFPVIFLGGTASNIPALYTLMNYADIKGGTWYPMGGMYKIVEAMHKLAVSLGVNFKFNEPVEQLIVKDNKIVGVQTTTQNYTADVIVSGADYEHTEQMLLQEPYRNYTKKYWDKRTMAPSSLLYYVGLNKKLPSLQHHSLFFDVPFDTHANELYKDKIWPTNPLFYVGAPSVTDNTVAPEGCENLFFLMPVTAGLEGDDENLRKKYFDTIVKRFEQHLGTTISDSIVYYKSFGITDFKSLYNSYKGNAYGLANTLMQTALLKPGLRNKKVSNLFYTGQLTVPGPGVPPSLISGAVVAQQVMKHFKKSM
jgi:phytoene desaturase